MWNYTRNLASYGVAINPFKVTILGGTGGIGRNLALMLKLNKNITELALHDYQSPQGLKEDLSHIDTKAKVTAYTGEKELVEALKCSNLLVITAGQAHSPEYPTREALFSANARLMKTFMQATTTACRSEMPFIHIITNPVNSLVPLCAEILKEMKCYDPKRISGSSSVDSMRARTFLGQFVGCDPGKIKVPVVGGHSAASITPLISQRHPKFPLTTAEQEQIILRIINGASEVVKAKETKGSAQLSMAHCVSQFCDSVARAYHGERGVMEVAFVPANINELDYFSCRFSLDQNGINDFPRLPKMSKFEEDLYRKAIEDITGNIERAMEFLKKDKERDATKGKIKQEGEIN